MTVLEIVVLVLYIPKCISDMEPFIEGGQYARIENFPHSVYLYLLCDLPHACGGSVLTQLVVLTAAHCFERCFRKHLVMAYAGSADTEKMTEADNITNFIIHKGYNTKTLHNDIALGFMKTDMKLGTTIKRVMISQNFPGVLMAQIAGWGLVNEETGQETQKLKMVTQILQRENVCRKAVSLKRGMMCAKNSLKNHPSRGDSGSALMSGNGQQIGLVSFRSANRKDIVVYTNVSYYYDWIRKHAVRLYCTSKK